MNRIIKIGYCDWCGNENLKEISSEQVYCHNCNEYTRKDKLKYRYANDSEELVYRPINEGIKEVKEKHHYLVAFVGPGCCSDYPINEIISSEIDSIEKIKIEDLKALLYSMKPSSYYNVRILNIIKIGG